jgi:glycosyltransferase involved in cell wall biosynthesis
MGNLDQSPYLSVIIPAYNEEERIAATLQAIFDYLTQQEYTWEILVVLDGAQDDTLGVVRAFAADKAHIRYIDRQENHGKGYTVRQGMLAAKGQIRLFTDADNSTDIAHFTQMRPLFAKGYDVVICSRDPKDVPGAQQVVPQPFLKRILGNLGNLFIQLVAVPGIWDTQCGFKAFTQEATEKIFPLQQIDGWGFDIEIMALAQLFRLQIGIIPARWVDKPGTHVRFSNYFDTIAETLKVRWNLMTGAYERQSDAIADIDTAS